jgi:tetratricopeptide (TPR) repeat protein
MKAMLLLFLLVISSSIFAQQSKAPDAAIWLDNGFIGGVDHKVTTKSADAQKYFNQGLGCIYGFNHEAAINSFKQAIKLDPDMAMAYWGISLALGSNYNVRADANALTEAYAYLQKAQAAAPKSSQAEQDYISALAQRYAADPKSDQSKLAVAYSKAMGDLSKKYPDDMDAATLYAESMMNLHPWQLWSSDGKPNEGTLEIIAVLEAVLKRDPNNIGANHYYIHAVEASPFPERALASAYRLGALAPSSGHLVHMPSHIYLRTGDFTAGAKSNELAITADQNYLKRSGSTGLYGLMYYNHNIHMLAASDIGRGNYAGAINNARQLAANVAPNLKAMPMLEMFLPYELVTFIRFNKTDEILRYPQPVPDAKVTNAWWRLARGLAFTETRKPAEAEKELAALREIMKATPFEMPIGNSLAQNVYKVADLMLTGEIAGAKGDTTAAIDSLRKAVDAADLVNYNEPPDFDIPVREWLGRALLRSGKFAEAEAVYRSELEKHPQSGRALFGLAEALDKQGKKTSADIVRRQYEEAWKDSDTKLTEAQLYGNRTITAMK